MTVTKFDLARSTEKEDIDVDIDRIKGSIPKIMRTI